MIKAQEQHCDPPPAVFGKPWFWQRSVGTMESTHSLAQVILEMRNEIKKLEAENQELRGNWSQRSSGAGMVENPYLNLRRNASAPVLERQYTEPTVMTVRRYCTSPILSGVSMRQTGTDRGRRAQSGWGRLQHEIQHGFSVVGSSVIEEAGKVANRHSLQEYVHRNRAKVKSVTFLLPVDDIYTSRPALTKHQEEPKVTHLTSIPEAESCVQSS